MQQFTKCKGTGLHCKQPFYAIALMDVIELSLNQCTQLYIGSKLEEILGSEKGTECFLKHFLNVIAGFGSPHSGWSGYI